MLELNNYYIQELENLADLFTSIFVIIDDIYNEIIPMSIRNRRNIKDSKLSDSEIITISIVSELLTIDSEKLFFSLLKREYKTLFPRLGDKGYINKRLTPELKSQRDINLLFFKRGNSKYDYPEEIRQLIFKVRRRIETSFSQLAEHLNLNKVKSKLMLRFITRTSIKVLANNISFLINQLMGNDGSIAKIKRLVFS